MIDNLDILPVFENALAKYRAQQFVEAKIIFDELVQSKTDGPSRMYLERCSEYISNPPTVDWDGVYTAKTK